MTDLNRVNSSNIDAVRADGAPFPAMRDGQPSGYGVTLAAATVYYFPVGAPKAPVPAEAGIVAVHLRWGAALIGVFTIEDSCFPATTSPGDGRGVADVTDFDQGPGNWIPENPNPGNVTVSVTAGATANGTTVTVAGGTAGGCMYHVVLGSRRMRVKAAVGATGDLVRAGVHGKAAG